MVDINAGTGARQWNNGMKMQWHHHVGSATLAFSLGRAMIET